MAKILARKNEQFGWKDENGLSDYQLLQKDLKFHTTRETADYLMSDMNRVGYRNKSFTSGNTKSGHIFSPGHNDSFTNNDMAAENNTTRIGFTPYMYTAIKLPEIEYFKKRGYNYWAQVGMGLTPEEKILMKTTAGLVDQHTGDIPNKEILKYSLYDINRNNYCMTVNEDGVLCGFIPYDERGFVYNRLYKTSSPNMCICGYKAPIIYPDFNVAGNDILRDSTLHYNPASDEDYNMMRRLQLYRFHYSPSPNNDKINSIIYIPSGVVGVFGQIPMISGIRLGEHSVGPRQWIFPSFPNGMKLTIRYRSIHGIKNGKIHTGIFAIFMGNTISRTLDDWMNNNPVRMGDLIHCGKIDSEYKTFSFNVTGDLYIRAMLGGSGDQHTHDDDIRFIKESLPSECLSWYT